MLKQHFTLLLIAHRLIARIDLSGKSAPNIVRFASQVSTEETSIQSKVQQSIELCKSKTGKILVVVEDSWSGCITLPPDVANFVSDTELTQTLALEAESYSGISAFDSQTVSREISPSDDGKTWWVTQFPNTTLSSIDRSLTKLGKKWELCSHFGLSPTHTNESEFLLEDPDQVQAWSKAFLLSLSNPENTPPVLRPTKLPATERREWGLSAFVCLLSISCCGALHWKGDAQSKQIDGAISRLEQEQQTLDSIRSRLTQNRKNLESKRTELTKASQQQQKSDSELKSVQAIERTLRDRWVDLVDTLVATSDEANWLRRIDSASSKTILQGWSLDDSSVHRLASGLEQATNDRGWHVHPARTKRMETQLVDFSIEMGPEKPKQESIE